MTLAHSVLSLPNRYARGAGSYPHALEASQHYWNTCRGLAESSLDRELLQQPLKELLAILTSFLPKRGQSVGKVQGGGGILHHTCMQGWIVLAADTVHMYCCALFSVIHVAMETALLFPLFR